MNHTTRFAAVFLGLLVSTIAADEDAKPKPLPHWVEYYKEVAKGYDLRLASAPDQPLTVVEAPILVYANPRSGGDTHGAFFVWTRNGRAEAIAAIWSKLATGSPDGDRGVHHEFQSLATEPLSAKGKDGVRWTPATPGLEFKLIPDAPVPAGSRAIRLAQMKEISRQFTGYEMRSGNGDSSTSKDFEYRLLPTPLYRYSDDNNRPVVDGAVFGFFNDWDPKILLVVETRPTDDGPRWHYAVGRVDNQPLRLQRNGVDVWKKPGNDFGSPTSAYFCTFDVATRPNRPK